ncbi:hypothetical protein FG386_000071 [Cryptosporidium ryanae]|uniref:uncharacterized protein n=1 Tax=Cryptosporidium ryanae TaxID=515981 RepID=UPI003519DFFD|nr:hypothetical protein FG386_000071 [Cryptosporidium ryanae]
MSEKIERLEFLYNPKALSEYDNEKYLLGEDIPEDKRKILGEYDYKSECAGSNGGNLDEIDDKEILNRLKEDPLLVIKKIELKHKKINEDYYKKKNEMSNLSSIGIGETEYKRKTTRRRTGKRSSLSRSPERVEHEYNYCKANSEVPAVSVSKTEKLQEIIENTKAIQNERINKYINAKKGLPKKSKHHFYNLPYLRKMINEINSRKTEHLYERHKYMEKNKT